MSRRRSVLLLGSFLLAAALGAAGDDETVPSPAAPDCAFRGTVDRDGERVRLDVARTALLAVPAHAAAAGDPVRRSPARGGGPVVGERRPVYEGIVDAEIFGAMKAAGFEPARPASDAEFLRRVSLDLTGRIPDPAAVTAFLADFSPDKRSRLVDQLLASDAFVSRWAQFFDDLLRNTAFPDSGTLYVRGRNAFHQYFVDALRARKPYDVMARELITGAGATDAAGAANFIVRNIQSNGPIQDTYDNLAADTGRVFLGTNALFCTTCHNGRGHLDAINLWGSGITRQDLWGMSAFFSRTAARRQGTSNADSYYAVSDGTSGNYSLNTTTGNKTARTPCPPVPTGPCNPYPTNPPTLTSISPSYVKTPANPGGGAPGTGEGYRAALARLVTADPLFAEAAVNRLWKELFTLGLVEPVEALDPARLDPANPPPGSWTLQPTHPALLKKLGAEFAAHGYDLRYLLGLLAKSQAYQLSSFYAGSWSDQGTRLFARHFPRRLRAEELFDALTKATNMPASMTVSGYTSPVAWAAELPDVSEPTGGATNGAIRSFLNNFLRGDRDTDERSSQFSILQAFSLLNDSAVVLPRISSIPPTSAVAKLIAKNAAPSEIVDTLYLGTLSRPPASEERGAAVALFSNLPPGRTKTTVAEDLQFALLNKVDFLFNY